jgi:hypothetical protein
VLCKACSPMILKIIWKEKEEETNKVPDIEEK